MEIYGTTGYIMANNNGIRFMTDPKKPEQEERIGPREVPYHDPFAFLAAVIRGSITMSGQDLSSLPVNMIAMEILDAAKRSSETGAVVYLDKK